MTEKWYGLIIGPANDFRSFQILHTESSGSKGTLMCEKNPDCTDKLGNQYYEHLKLREKMVERFSIHIYQKRVRLTNTPQSY